ncbi:hypothetical protein DFH28DRAFT_1102786 [Melampsora americana]|nr:hypothetical protein DFH28DRAFT_1102786 [Melampsora americana]
MSKENKIRTPCFRASQLRSFCLVAFLLCQSLQSVVSLPSILSDVELASKIRAEPTLELSQSAHTSEDTLKILSSDELQAPKSVALDDSYRAPMKKVQDQPLPTDADSVRATNTPSNSRRPEATSFLTWTKKHKDMVQARLNEMAERNNFATPAQINRMFYEAESKLSGKPLEEVYKEIKPESYQIIQTPATVPPISKYAPHGPSHWTNEIQANAANVPHFSTYAPSQWANDIQAKNLNHMGSDPSWQPSAFNNPNEFASSQMHYQDPFNSQNHAGLIHPSPYAAQHVGPDGFNNYITPDVGYTQGYHSYSYDPARLHPEARKDGTGYFYPQHPHNLPYHEYHQSHNSPYYEYDQSHNLPHYEYDQSHNVPYHEYAQPYNLPYHGYDHDWKENGLDYEKEWQELNGEIDKYRHHEGFRRDDLPHVDEIFYHDGIKEPQTPYNKHFPSFQSSEVQKSHQDPDTLSKNLYSNHDSYALHGQAPPDSGVNYLDQDRPYNAQRISLPGKNLYPTKDRNERLDRFSSFGRIDHPQHIGSSESRDQTAQLTPPSRPPRLNYPSFDFLSPNQHHDVWPTTEPPITTNIGQRRTTVGPPITTYFKQRRPTVDLPIITNIEQRRPTYSQALVGQ